MRPKNVYLKQQQGNRRRETSSSGAQFSGYIILPSLPYLGTNSIRRRCCCKHTAHCNASSDSENVLGKLQLHRKLCPALKRRQINCRDFYRPKPASWVATWLSGSVLVSINEVTLRRARMGDRLRAVKPPRFVTSHSGQLSLLPSAERKMSTGQSTRRSAAGK